ncbi:MAG: PEP-CTERM sorting domain-containing protein [Planctomycetota bacterium]
MKLKAKITANFRLCLAYVVLVFGVALTVAPAHAVPPTTTTWSGLGGSGNWSDASNWSTPPTTSNNWGLVFGGTTRTTGTNNIGTINTVAMSFTNNGSAGQTSTFTLSGSTLALNSSAITTTAGGSAGDTVGNALTLSGSSTVTLNNGHSLSLTGGVTGTGSVSGFGSGTNTAILYIAGSNSYSGNTYVTGVRVQNALGNSLTNTGDTNNNAFGTGGVYVSGSGSVLVRNSSTIANNFTLDGAGAVISGVTQGAIKGSFAVGNQTATLSGTVTLSAAATLKTASTAALSGNKMVLSGPVNLGSNVLTLSPGASGTNATPIEITGAVNGTGAIVVNGTGSSVLLSGANGYTGGTTITAGTLRAGSGGALGTGGLAVNAGGLDLNGQSLAIGTLSGSSGGVITSAVAGAASLTTNSAVNSNYMGSITDGAGVVSLIKTGVGELDLSGSSSFSGGVIVTNGRVQNAYSTSLINQSATNDYGFGTGLVTASGSGTVVVRNGSTIANNFNIGGNGTTSGTTVLGAIRASFGVNNQTATLSGSMALSADAKIVSAASATGFTGNSLLISGPVSLGNNTLTFAAGVSGSAALPIVVTGVISGSGAVVLDGSSPVYFNAANTYSGTTTVNAGTLGGSGTIAGAVNMQNGTIAPGGSEGAIGTLTVGSLQLASGATAAMTISDLANYDRIVSNSSVGFGATGGSVAVDFMANGFANFSAWQLFSGSSFNGHLFSFAISGSYGTPTFAYADGEWKADIGGGQTMSFYEDNRYAIGDRYKAGQLVVVPEPSSLAIAGIGLCVAGWYRLRRRRVVA